MKSVEYELERLTEDHPVQSGLFIPYLIARLTDKPENRKARITVQIMGLPLRENWYRSMSLDGMA